MVQTLNEQMRAVWCAGSVSKAAVEREDMQEADLGTSTDARPDTRVDRAGHAGAAMPQCPYGFLASERYCGGRKVTHAMRTASPRIFIEYGEASGGGS